MRRPARTVVTLSSSLALGLAAGVGVAACGEDRGSVEVEGGTTGTVGTATDGATGTTPTTGTTGTTGTTD